MNIRVVKTKISTVELKKLAEEIFGEMVKGVVDVEKEILALGGEYHIDSNEVLISDGSHQSQVWGINIYIDQSHDERIEYHSLINIRPAMGNRSSVVEDEDLKKKIKAIVDKLIE